MDAVQNSDERRDGKPCCVEFSVTVPPALALKTLVNCPESSYRKRRLYAEGIGLQLAGEEREQEAVVTAVLT
jgi:hypothetical protein